MTATARLISGNRLHLQHGPIDLIIGADGAREQVELAYRAAVAAFPEILPALAGELALLRAPIAGGLPLSPAASGERAEAGPSWSAEGEGRPFGRCLPTGLRRADLKAPVQVMEQVAAPHPNPLPRKGGGEGISPVARRMIEAVWPFRDQFITPMAAVAGSVADEMLGIICRAATLDRAYVNNGGDIAIHLANSAIFTIGVVGDLTAPGIDARTTTRAGDGIGGIATSGWRGRSQSLGVADAVTVLARTAAEADAAATMIANAVNVDDPAIRRLPAHEVKDDSDLRDLLVTVGVGQLSDEQRAKAISFGADRAGQILSKNLIVAAYIQLQDKMVVVGGNALIAQAA